MKVIDPGHSYELTNIDGSGSNFLTFVKREGPGFPGNVGHHEGTNLQEVIRVLIDRVKYLNNQIYDERNNAIIRYLRLSLMYLEHRAAERHNRELGVLLDTIENQSVCERCGHIGCRKENHAH